MPVGPNSPLEFVEDTVDSVFRYLREVVLVIADNTVRGLTLRARPEHERIWTIRFPNDGRYSTLGRLYCHLGTCVEQILDRLDFEVLLRLDDDALLIGADADVEAAAYFRAHPRVGLLGSYRRTCTGAPRSFDSPRRTLRHEVYALGALRRPRRAAALRRLRRAARAHGYEDGEHCLAAACFFSHAALTTMRERGFFGQRVLATSNLGDDHMFGLLVRAAGLEIADFATDGHPLALSFRGLPMAPDELVAKRKKIVHSLKDHEGARQAELRARFHRLLDHAS